ncbi:MAG: FG-GAP-like repeat-containing protein [Bacteroidia bacterium]|nr:FG-GAP-like repeat-containing protein [Bacteroidia bacterium]
MKKILLPLLLIGGVLRLAGQVNFEDKAGLQGINHNYGIYSPSGGVSFYDFNNDGWDDLTLATPAGEKLHFYKNNHGSFQKIAALVNHNDRAQQVLWADYDNDGDPDLFVTASDAPNRLYQNQGNLHLSDVTALSGLQMNNLPTYGATWGDYDRDGWLDLYYVDRPNALAGPTSAHLYRNNADGTFTETTLAAQVADSVKIPWVTAFIDINNDLWPDIFTAQDKLSKNSLFKNLGNGTFANISAASGANLAMNSMSVTPADFDQNGYLDIYITNTNQGNKLLHNNGDETFSEMAVAAGVQFLSISWGAQFADLDNDTDLDLYVSGAEIGSTGPLSSACYLNNGTGQYNRVTNSFAGDTVASYANAVGDFNRDGYPDLMVINEEPFNSQLWQNSGGSNHWIKIRLQGTLSNREGLGAWIEVFAAGEKYVHYTLSASGFLGQNSATQIFGLGTATQADSVIVRWPSGNTDHLYNLPAGKDLTIVEGGTTFNTGIFAETVSLPLKIYPNPAHDWLTLEWAGKSAETLEVQLINSVGQTLRQVEWKTALSGNSLPLLIQNFPEGFYHLRIISVEGIQSYPFLIK